MSELLDNLIAQAGGLDLVGVLLGMVLIVVGAAILMVVLLGQMSARTPDAASRLLPTLAEDVLDDELQQIYRQTLWLDALIARHHAPLGGPTGTELGRRVRRELVALQAERFAAKNARGEHPVGDARLEELRDVVEQACELAEASEPTRRGRAELAEALADIDERLGSA